MRKILFVLDPDKPDYYQLLRDSIKATEELSGGVIECEFETFDDAPRVAKFFRPDRVVYWLPDHNRYYWDKQTAITAINESAKEVINDPLKAKLCGRVTSLYYVMPNYCPKFCGPARNAFRLLDCDRIILRINGEHGRSFNTIHRLEHNKVDVYADHFKNPDAIITEYVDTYYEPLQRWIKYRCLVFDDTVLPMHVQTSMKNTLNPDQEKNAWIVRGDKRVFDETECLIEREYFASGISPKHKPIFIEARKKLGLDWTTFDYSFTPDDRLIIWESNHLPYLHMIQPKVIAHHCMMNYAGIHGHSEWRNGVMAYNLERLLQFFLNERKVIQ